jgi:RNA polymerase sigma-70 factor (ECF subfamily)
MTPQEYNRSVDQFADGAYRFVLSNIRDEDEAKDIIQDTFEKLWVHHENVNFEKVKSYIFTTAYRTMIDKIRRDKKSERMEESHEDMLTDHSEYSGLKGILHEGLKRLPEIQRTVLTLRDYEGYNYKEIGDITSLNESQVKVYIYRARVFLKQYIGKLENVI